MTKSLDGLSSRVDMKVNRIRELENRSIEFTESDRQTKNRLKKNIVAEFQGLGKQ